MKITCSHAKICLKKTIQAITARGQISQYQGGNLSKDEQNLPVYLYLLQENRTATTEIASHDSADSPHILVTGTYQIMTDKGKKTRSSSSVAYIQCDQVVLIVQNCEPRRIMIKRGQIIKLYK